MKRYKLLKDLPTFKAGDEFELREDGDLYLADVWEHKEHWAFQVRAYCSTTLNRFPNILKDWFEEIPEQPKTIYDLKDGDKWYFINHNSERCYISESYGLSCIDAFRGVGNVFLTREEAEKELTRRKAKQIILRDTKGFKPNWNGGGGSYQVYYDYSTKSWDCGWFNSNDGTIRFATKDDARASIKAHEREWKIYLGVEE